MQCGAGDPTPASEIPRTAADLGGDDAYGLLRYNTVPRGGRVRPLTCGLDRWQRMLAL